MPPTVRLQPAAAALGWRLGASQPSPAPLTLTVCCLHARPLNGFFFFFLSPTSGFLSLFVISLSLSLPLHYHTPSPCLSFSLSLSLSSMYYIIQFFFIFRCFTIKQRPLPSLPWVKRHNTKGIYKKQCSEATVCLQRFCMKILDWMMHTECFYSAKNHIHRVSEELCIIGN